MLWGDLTPLDDLPNYEARVLNPYKHEGPEEAARPTSSSRRRWRGSSSAAADEDAYRKAGKPRRSPITFADGTPMWYRADHARQEGIPVHPGRDLQAGLPDGLPRQGQGPGDGRIRPHRQPPDAADGRRPDWVATKAGDLAGAVVVNLPMEQTNKAINRNRAILITAALVTAILAMVASYMIVRYVIVKPVKHLRDVSDAIAAGKLNIRSQIQTGDEFEELSHAFNRMLHNLVAMQQELREVNDDLDRKVDELAQANMALYEMNRLKSDFLATMSHELRTPLNSIIGFSEVLAGSEQLNERQRRYAANIQSSGKMLLGMINDILDLAKIESGKMEVRIEDFSIRDVCEALTNLARPIAERKNIDLECRLDEAIPLLRQDPGKLQQILYNLLSNAIKFTPEGGRVTLRAQDRGAVRGARGRGHRDRHRRGGPGDDLREVPPGRRARPGGRRPDPRAPGDRPGPVDRPRADQAARRRRPPGEPARARGARSRSGCRCSCRATASSRSTCPTSGSTCPRPGGSSPDAPLPHLASPAERPPPAPARPVRRTGRGPDGASTARGETVNSDDSDRPARRSAS